MKKNVLLAAAFAAIGTTASAVPVEWVITGVQFNDLSVLENNQRSYIYDADTGEFSGINIQTRPSGFGNVNTGALYTVDSGGGADEPVFETADATRFFGFTLVDDMTNAGGTLSIVSGTEGFFGTDRQRTIRNLPIIGDNPRVVGTVLPMAAVPLPAGLPLLLAGLGAFGILRRKRA